MAKPGNYDVLKGVAKNFSIPAAMIMRAKVWPRRAIRDCEKLNDCHIKFIYSEKATIFCEISINY